jgi:regulator of protease activity HflC (stomatin/prohibitin superfamily)
MIIDTTDPVPKTKDGPAGNAFRDSFATVRDFVRRFSNHIFLTIAVVIFLIVYLAPKIFITVPPGNVGVLYLRFYGGTQTNLVVREGLAIIWPWDKIFLYTIRVQEANDKMVVLTTEGLPVTLELSVRYRPEEDLVGLLHQRVGPDYKDRIVIPEVEAAIRSTMAGLSMDQIWGAEHGLVARVINNSLERVSENFVTIDTIVLRSVELPPKVRDAVEEKMTQRELFESYKFRQEIAEAEAERKTTEAAGLKSYNDIVNSSLTENLLKWRGIDATRELATSPNTKTVIVGGTGAGLPLILGGDK